MITAQKENSDLKREIKDLKQEIEKVNIQQTEQMKQKLQLLEDEKIELQQLLKDNDQRFELQSSKHQKELAIL